MIIKVLEWLEAVASDRASGMIDRVWAPLDHCDRLKAHMYNISFNK
jgi:hypothetical protein